MSLPQTLSDHFPAHPIHIAATALSSNAPEHPVTAELKRMMKAQAY
jgi:hypothetical protein